VRLNRESRARHLDVWSLTADVTLTLVRLVDLLPKGRSSSP
jgi:hypothetical protein